MTTSDPVTGTGVVKSPNSCWRFMQGSYCPEELCHYQHGPPLHGTRLPRRTAASYGRTACLYFAQGYCKYGEKCAFAHIPLTNGPQSVSASLRNYSINGIHIKPHLTRPHPLMKPLETHGLRHLPKILRTPRPACIDCLPNKTQRLGFLLKISNILQDTYRRIRDIRWCGAIRKKATKWKILQQPCNIWTNPVHARFTTTKRY